LDCGPCPALLPFGSESGCRGSLVAGQRADSDINSLLNALHRTAQGSPVFNESDPAAVAWRE